MHSTNLFGTTILIAAMVLILTHSAYAQITNNQATGTLQVNVAQNANISLSSGGMDFGWIVKGGPINRILYDSPDAMRFDVSGQPGATYDIHFPFQIALTLIVGGNPVSGTTINWRRHRVALIKTVGTPTGATPVLSNVIILANVNTDVTRTGESFLSGTATQTAYNSYFIGGEIPIVANSKPNGLYVGTYTATITNYSI